MTRKVRTTNAVMVEMSNLDWSRWPDFSKEEFKCPHCGECHMDDAFMDKLQNIRSKVGIPFIVTSGYRCPEYNDKISTTGRNGPHTTGKAVDISIGPAHTYQVLKMALSEGFTGIGIHQTGPSNERFLHLDTLVTNPRPNVWTYG